MKKKFFLVAGVCACVHTLVVLAGCASIANKYFDDDTTTFLPNGTVQWMANLEG